MHPDVEVGVSFAVSNPFWGEEIAAAVVLKSGIKASDSLASDIRAHAATRLTQDFKVPRQVTIFPSRRTRWEMKFSARHKVNDAHLRECIRA
jgi:acyl-coenzyme A synthetase/AMP-(fatty) acid ligase